MEQRPRDPCVKDTPVTSDRKRTARASLFLLVLAIGCGGPGDGGRGDGAVSSDSGPGATPSDPATRAVRVSQGSDVLSMDPYAHHESPTFAVHRNIFDPLTDMDADYAVVPALATAWETESPTSWLFHLRESVSFHDGQPFTADDAAFSIDRALNDPRSRVAPEIQTIAAVEVVDPLTLRIRTRVPDAILPLRLPPILVMDKESTEAGIARDGEAYVATHANGAGPYRLSEWRKDERCVLVANESYWGGAPAVSRLEFIPVNNEATRMAALENGEVDLLVNVPTRNVERVRRNQDYAVVQRPSLRLIYLGLDCGRSPSPGIIQPADRNPLTDPRVRRAIALGIDNRLIVRTIMDGHAQPADQLIPEGDTGYDPSLVFPRPDYDRAKALLAEAGYPNGFKLRLDGPNDRYVNDDQIMQAVAQELARIGVAVTANAQPKARFFADERAGACSFFLIGWANTNGDGVGTFEHLLHTLDKEKNLGGANTSTNYSNPRLDALVEQAASEFDPAKREAMIQQANRIAMQDLPHIPLHFQMDIYAVRKNLTWSPRRDTQVRGVDIRFK
jgi:peptide/nickel transport system substrate-binding protein